MKTRYLFWILITSVIGWMGCSDDEKLEPSGTLVDGIELPQGNHDYDARIVDWYERTGIYFLYKFEPKDVYFNVNDSWRELYTDTIVTSIIYGKNQFYVEDSVIHAGTASYRLGKTYNKQGLWTIATLDEKKEEAYIRYQVLKNKGVFKVEEADENYAGEQLAWIEDMFIKSYTDSVLKVAMPLKVILGRGLKGGKVTWISYGEVFLSYNNLIFNRGDESINTLTPAKKEQVRQDIHLWFTTQRITTRDSYEDFASVTDYYWTTDVSFDVPPAESQCYALGLVKRPPQTILSGTWEDDRDAYLKMIFCNSYAKLTAEPQSGDFSGTDYTGILHPKKDVNGLIRKKYDILIDKFKRLGVDLQGIGE